MVYSSIQTSMVKQGLVTIQIMKYTKYLSRHYLQNSFQLFVAVRWPIYLPVGRHSICILNSVQSSLLSASIYAMTFCLMPLSTDVMEVKL